MWGWLNALTIGQGDAAIIGSATPEKVLAAETFMSAGSQSVQTGTMVNRSNATSPPNGQPLAATGSLTIFPQNGFYDGTSAKVQLSDGDFMPTNIKAGIDLFGMAGSLEVPVFKHVQGTNTAPWANNNTSNISAEVGFTVPTGMTLQAFMVTIADANGDEIVYTSSAAVAFRGVTGAIMPNTQIQTTTITLGSDVVTIAITVHGVNANNLTFGISISAAAGTFASATPTGLFTVDLFGTE